MTTLKEQQTFWKGIDANLVEIKGMDNDIVKSLKLITSGEEEQIDIWLENIKWKNDSMNQQLSEGEQFLNSCKLLKKKALGDILMIVEGIPISEHTQSPDMSSILKCIEAKISTELSSKQNSDANIMTKLSSLSVALDSYIQNLPGYVIELDEVRKNHELCKLKMQSLIIVKNKTLAQVIKSFRAYKANLTQLLTTPTDQRASSGNASD